MNLDEVKALDKGHLFQNYGRQGLCFERGEKEILWDLDGRRYIDMVAGIAVNSLGYSHPTVTKAICEQAGRLMHVSNLYLVKEQAEAAAALTSICPAPLSKVLFVNSGAEANETALKLASKHTGRSRMVTCRNSFHGRTAAALSATGQEKYQAGFEPLLSKAFDMVDYGSVEQLKSAVTSNTAAVILEPIQGEAGSYRRGRSSSAPPGTSAMSTEPFSYAMRCRPACAAPGACSASSIMVWCRTSSPWPRRLGTASPSALASLPRTSRRPSCPAPMGPRSEATRLGAAVVRTVIDTMKAERLDGVAAEKGELWMKRLKELSIRSGGRIKSVRGKGLMIGLEMGEDAKRCRPMRLPMASWSTSAPGKWCG